MKRRGEESLKDRRLVLDTGALFLYFAGDEETTKIIDSRRSAGLELLTCEVVMAEFYYKTCEKFGRDVAELRCTSIRKSGIAVEPIDEKLTSIASIFRCKNRAKVSLADSYVIALCKVKDARLITTDGLLKELNPNQTTLLKVPKS